MNNKKSPKRQKPLRTFSWSYKDHKTTAELLVEDTISEWYEAKHRATSNSEIDFINSILIKCCHHCSSSKIVKNGFNRNNIQNYFCKDCGRNFNPLTNTIFDSRKIPISEWFEYLLHLFEYHSITSSAYDNRNANSTGEYWLIKVFEVLKDIQQDVVLSGRIFIDETYFSKKKSDVITKNGKKLRGISINKIGVATAISEDMKSSFLIATNTSKPSRKSTLNSYASHIEEGSTIIHDGDNSHIVLIETLHLNSEEHPSIETKNLKDKENPMYPINHYHSLLKRFMRAHSGYNRDNLQDWLNLFWFITNKPNDRYDKVLRFIELAISSPKRVKYRDVMSSISTK